MRKADAMTIADVAALAGAATLLGVHAASAVTAAWRQVPRAPIRPDVDAKVTIIRPLKGLDEYARACLASTFDLDHSNIEIIFCVANASDPVIPLVRSLIAEHPRADARLLIGDDRFSDNPKLNNLVKGYASASNDWIAFVDANVLLPRDAVARLWRSVGPSVGVISSPPVGVLAQGWEGLAECAVLNSYQARWQSFADAVGHGFAQGKVLMFRRSWLEATGGLQGLGSEPAEDAAATKVARANGRRVVLLDRFFPQPIGKRRLKDVWDRQARWASLRRASFPFHYACEVFSFPWIPTALAMAAAGDESGRIAASAGMLFVWYGVEAGCGWLVGWPERTHHRLIRDVLLPLAWVRGWLYRDFVWHGHALRAERDPMLTRA